MTPTVGRIVHYRAEADGPCLAAIVTAVHPTGNVNLAVFDEVADVLQRYGIDEGAADDPTGGMWHSARSAESARSAAESAAYEAEIEWQVAHLVAVLELPAEVAIGLPVPA